MFIFNLSQLFIYEKVENHAAQLDFNLIYTAY